LLFTDLADQSIHL